jgi:uncharacterized membrane protein
VRTERGFDRLVNFSDAVVAIAITLLILPLVDTAANIGSQHAGDLIAKDGYKIFIFALSFAVMGRFWLAHHQIYESVVGYTASLIWANFLWLISIVFLPFPTELLAASNHQERAIYAVYVGTLLVTSASLLLQEWIIMRSPEVQSEAARDKGTVTLIPAGLATAFMALAFIIAVAIPGIGLWGLMLVFLSEPIQRVWMRRRRAETAVG